MHHARGAVAKGQMSIGFWYVTWIVDDSIRIHEFTQQPAIDWHEKHVCVFPRQCIACASLMRRQGRGFVGVRLKLKAQNVSLTLVCFLCRPGMNISYTSQICIRCCEEHDHPWSGILHSLRHWSAQAVRYAPVGHQHGLDTGLKKIHSTGVIRAARDSLSWLSLLIMSDLSSQDMLSWSVSGPLLGNAVD